MELIEGSKARDRLELERAALRAVIAGAPERYDLLRRLKRPANDAALLHTVDSSEDGGPPADLAASE